MKIKIVNYGMGNIKSVQRAFKRVNFDVEVTNDLQELEKADKIILPGVGHFSAGIINLQKDGLSDVLKELILVKKKPVLGICLGMQLLTNNSEEGNIKGFGIIDLETKKFQLENLKVPHIGWNNVVLEKYSPLYKGINEEDKFYFVHSYYVENKELSNEALTTTSYGIDFVSSVSKDNIFATQFHPEKSQKPGLKLLENFAKI